jgi:hypothetical protein
VPASISAYLALASPAFSELPRHCPFQLGQAFLLEFHGRPHFGLHAACPVILRDGILAFDHVSGDVSFAEMIDANSRENSA